MHKLKSYFIFSKSHRSGILLLLILMVLVQLCYYFISNQKPSTSEDTSWLLTQNEIDSLKQNRATKKDTIYPFNPNFITDYKGYKLGMSVQEIDRLHQYRAQNKYVNSASEFQKVTKVSSDLLQKISPYFKFPDWVTNGTSKNYQSKFESTYKKFDKKESKIVVQDLNTANQVELEKVYMIGEKLAVKILSEREKFGNFASMEQLGFIWGISPEAIADLNKKFQIKSSGNLKKININTFTIKELQQFPYFNYTIAKNIVTFRSMNGDFKSSEDLTNVKQFPLEKLKIIALYLEF